MIAHNCCQQDIECLKNFYEAEYGVTFAHDRLRYDFAFLTHVDINQAIKLYDGLTDDKKIDLISVIKEDHIHLHKLITIHEIICDMYQVDDILNNAFIHTQPSPMILN